MDENKLRKIAINLIDNCQRNTVIDADKENFIYLMAYNDGVLDLMKALLKELSESEDIE